MDSRRTFQSSLALIMADGGQRTRCRRSCKVVVDNSLSDINDMNGLNLFNLVSRVR